MLDVAVVGGGFTGASLATALARSPALSGGHLVVLEARAGRNPRFAGELIHPTGVDILDAETLLPSLERAGGVPVAGFAVVPAGEDAALLPYAQVSGGRAEGLGIDHHTMVARLRAQAASQSNVELRTGERVVDLLREGGRVSGVVTEGGKQIRARLTLIAEGRHSRLRRLLDAGEQARLVSYTAAVLVERTALPHARYGHIFLDAPGPILAYPIAEDEHGTTARMCLDVPTDLLESHKGPALAGLLRERYAPLVPRPLRDALLESLATRPPEVAANQAIYTRSCVAPGVALVGESGGCSHPLTAAGMTICLNDIRILLEEMQGSIATGHEFFDDAGLARYQRRRYRFARVREVLADALYEVFRGADEGARAIRTGIFGYWRGSDRARSASMALLTGADSRLHSFMAEYLRVVARSASCSLRGRVPGNSSSLTGRLAGLGGLAGKSLDKLRIVASHVRSGDMA